MKLQILDKTKKKKIIEELKVFGISKAPYLFVRTGKEKVRAYSGAFSSDELQKLGKVLMISEIGMYFAKAMIDGRSKRLVVRTNIDVMHVLRGQVSKNVIVLDAGQEESWFFGEDVELEKQQTGEMVGGGFVVLQSGDVFGDLIGVGRLSSDKRMVSNYLPKERRVKSNT